MTQRVVLIATTTPAAQVRPRLGRRPLVLCAPTPEAKRIVAGLAVRAPGLEATPEVLLTPVTTSGPQRGHDLEALVRRHALADRYRDVVVVADPGTTALVARGLTGHRGPTAPMTVVGLPRGGRPFATPWWAVCAAGFLLAVVAGLLVPRLHLLAVPALVAAVGVGLVPSGRTRPLGLAVLAAAGVALVLVLLGVSSARRFPAQ